MGQIYFHLIFTDRISSLMIAFLETRVCEYRLINTWVVCYTENWCAWARACSHIDFQSMGYGNSGAGVVKWGNNLSQQWGQVREGTWLLGRVVCVLQSTQAYEVSTLKLSLGAPVSRKWRGWHGLNARLPEFNFPSLTPIKWKRILVFLSSLAPSSFHPFVGLAQFKIDYSGKEFTEISFLIYLVFIGCFFTADAI